MKTKHYLPFTAFFLVSILFFSSCDKKPENHIVEEYAEDESKPDALDALDNWWAYRAYPGKSINMKAYSQAYESLSAKRNAQSDGFDGQWDGKGPKNFGGRTLCLAFNPQNSNTIYAGSASGGLWRSYTGGIGPNAWEYIPTGFPVLGVSAIVISPQDSNTIYIGTGEVYNYQNTGSGTVERTTRGTYGIGILKSVDGGLSWTKSLDWSMDELKGIQDMKINPLDPNIVVAATSEGFYKTIDAGQTWQQKHSVLMTTDIEYKPGDTSVIYIASGNSGTPGSGIYKSIDGGETFTKLTNGLPASYTGKTLLHIAPSAPNTIFASVADQFQQIGLFRSQDEGQTWSNINSDDISLYQGWFSHDIAVMPNNLNHMVWAGVDVYNSTNGGANFTRKSYWYNWSFNATPIGGPEGPSDYVHADIHRIYVKPGTDSTFYFATDGGIFISYDGGETFSGHNGQYQTTQFYANVSNATLDTNFFIGGLQDNATAVYEGDPAWRRVIGGDGMSTAIVPGNDNIVFASAQRLNMFKSNDKAQNFFNIQPGSSNQNPTAFNGPFAIAPSQTNTVYAGRDIFYKSTNGGTGWQVMNSGAPINGQVINTITVGQNDANLIYCSTVAADLSGVDLMKSTNGGQSWQSVFQNLPNRIIMDLAISNTNINDVYVVLSGYGTDHLYKSTDGGSTWTASSTGLPDVPHNSIVIDEMNNDIIYVGNDLGMFVSTDAGASWQDYNSGLEDATLVMSMDYNIISRKMRIGTHGKGMFERPMIDPLMTSLAKEEKSYFKIYPNPARDFFKIQLNEYSEDLQVELIDLKGKTIKSIQVKGENTIEVSLENIKAGIYIVKLSNGKIDMRQRVIVE